MILTTLKRITKYLDQKHFYNILEQESKQIERDKKMKETIDFNEKIMENPFYQDLFEFADQIEEILKNSELTYQETGFSITEYWGSCSSGTSYEFFLENYCHKIPNIVLDNFSKSDICRFFNRSGFTKSYFEYVVSIDFEIIGNDLHIICGEIS